MIGSTNTGQDDRPAHSSALPRPRVMPAHVIPLPPRADLLIAPSRCPWCSFGPVAAPLCPACGFDFRCAEAGEAWRASEQAVGALQRRAELLQLAHQRGQALLLQQREAVARAHAVAAKASHAQGRPPHPAPQATVPQSGAPPHQHPTPRAHPTPAHTPVAPVPPAPKRSAVQILMLVLGIALLSVASIVFLIFAWVIAGVVGRTIVVGFLTLTVLVLSAVLARGKLRGTAEGLAVLGSVLLLLDCWGMQSEDLLNIPSHLTGISWGAALVAVSALHLGWAAIGRLRAPLIVSAFLLPFAGLVTVDGLTNVLEIELPAAMAFLAVAGLALVHPAYQAVLDRRSALHGLAAGAPGQPPKHRSFEPRMLQAAAVVSLAVVLLILLGSVFGGSVVSAGAPFLLTGCVLAALSACVAAGHALLSWQRRPRSRFSLGAWFLAFTLPFAALAVMSLALSLSADIPAARIVGDTVFTLMLPVALALAYVLHTRVRALAGHTLPLLLVTSATFAIPIAVWLLLLLVSPFEWAFTTSSVQELDGVLLAVWPEAAGHRLGLGLGFIAAAILLTVGHRRSRLTSLAVPLSAAAAVAALANGMPIWLAAWLVAVLGLLGVAMLSVLDARQAQATPPPLTGAQARSAGVFAAVAYLLLETIGFALAHAAASAATILVIAGICWLVTLGRGATTRTVIWSLMPPLLTLLAVVTVMTWSAELQPLEFSPVLTACVLVNTALLARTLAFDRQQLARVLSTATGVALGTLALPFLVLVVGTVFDSPELPVLATIAIVGSLVLFAATLVWARMALPKRFLSAAASAILPLTALPGISMLLPRSFEPFPLRPAESMGPIGSAPLTLMLGALLAAGIVLILRSARRGPQADALRPAEWTVVGLVGAALPTIFASGPATATITLLGLALTLNFLALPSRVTDAHTVSPAARRVRRSLLTPVPALVSLAFWSACEAWMPGLAASWRMTVIGGLFMASAWLLWSVTRAATSPKLAPNVAFYAALAPLLLFTPHLVAALGSPNLEPHTALPVLAAVFVVACVTVIPFTRASLRRLLQLFAWSGVATSCITTLLWFAAPVATRIPCVLGAAAALVVLTIVGWFAASAFARARQQATPRAALVLMLCMLELLVFTTAFWSPERLLQDLTRIALVVVLGVLTMALAAAPERVGQALAPRNAGFVFVLTTGVIICTAITELIVGGTSPLELASWWRTEALVLPLGLAWLVVGSLFLRRYRAVSSWQALAPGLLVLSLPMLLAELAAPHGIRAIVLAACTVLAVILGAVFRMQAPLLIGAVTTLLHALITFWAVAVLVWTSVPWWMWTALAGSVLVVLAATFEAQIHNAKRMATAFSKLR